MTYRNKKDPTVTAVLDFEDPKYKTVQMIYLTGENKGKSFSINHSTLKMWWEEVKSDDVKTEKPKSKTEKPKSVLDKIDYDQVNTPYPEPKKQKYIPVPQSVIDYENRYKVTRKKGDFTTPNNYEEFADLLAKHNIKIKRVNTGYISLWDNSKLKLQNGRIALLASTDIGSELSSKGFKCEKCIEKGTPFRYNFTTQEDFETMLGVISDVSNKTISQ